MDRLKTRGAAGERLRAALAKVSRDDIAEALQEEMLFRLDHLTHALLFARWKRLSAACIAALGRTAELRGQEMLDAWRDDERAQAASERAWHDLQKFDEETRSASAERQ